MSMHGSAWVCGGGRGKVKQARKKKGGRGEGVLDELIGIDVKIDI